MPDLEDGSLSWSFIWNVCEDFRKEHHIPSEEAVVLLTDLPNEGNWFASGLENEKRDFFVRTDEKDWKKYVEAPWIYPTASELASIILVIGGFKNLYEIERIAHRHSRGCIFDFCQLKEDIRLRLRTADICQDCRSELIRRNIDSSLLRQVFALMEGIRGQMLFRERLTILNEPSRMIVDCIKKTLYFPDFGNITIEFNAQQMMIYHFFLNHPQGIYFSDLPNYRDELKQLYMEYKGAVMLTTIINEIDDIVNPNVRKQIEKYDQAVNKIIEKPNTSLSAIISKINKKIEAKIDSRIKDKYCILTERSHKISLNQELISFTTKLFLPGLSR